MPTNLALNDKLIQQVQKIGKFKSKKDAVNSALLEFVQRRSQASILELAGKINYYPDYDHKKLRSGKDNGRSH
ncbi:MAG TPA: type II toxin-antitoxin system VapB family antitoxin [Phycisphaerae bacterium]|jgi:Arc/MetJ family transcription regulator